MLLVVPTDGLEVLGGGSETGFKFVRLKGSLPKLFTVLVPKLLLLPKGSLFGALLKLEEKLEPNGSVSLLPKGSVFIFREFS